MVNFKQCVECMINWPLFMYKTDTRKFILPVAKGRVRRCRICLWKESGKGPVVRWTGSDFKLVTLTLKQRLRELIAK